MDKNELRKKLLETFKVEALEHIKEIGDCLLIIEKCQSNNEWIQVTEKIHRETHSLKGAARAVNNGDIEIICQTMESIFSGWKHEKITVHSSEFDLLHSSIKVLSFCLAHIDQPQRDSDKKLLFDLVERLNLLKDGHLKDHANEIKKEMKPFRIDQEKTDYFSLIETVRIPSKKLDALLLKAEEILSVKLVLNQYANRLSELNESLHSWKKEWQSTIAKTNSNSLEEYLNQGLKRLKTIEHESHLLLSQLNTNSKGVNSLVDGLLDDAKKMVLLPFSTLLDSFPTMVRNVCHEQGKDVNLIIEGSEIEIDKRILEDLKDPLIHMVRNCIDHGFEKTDDRIALGKIAQGTLRIAITQITGNEVAITISDDGRGINAEAVKLSAIKQGYINTETAQQLDHESSLSLIFQSGVSTSPIITELSGHGLGMAIVSEKLEKLSGHIKLTSDVGRGTQFLMTIPLTFSIFKGILLRVSNHLLILPTVYIDRILRVSSKNIKTIENTQSLLLNGESLSLVLLSNVLNLPSTVQNKNADQLFPVIILQTNETRIAFQVDEVLSEQEVLVKKLNRPLVRVNYIAAVTILGNGIPVPILNASDLIKESCKTKFTPIQSPMENKKDGNTKSILIAEDSITTRMLLKNILEMAGYRVMTAVDGADAWRILRENDIGLLVSDVEMPRMDGFELTDKVRKDSNFAELPVVLVTSRESPEDRERGIDVGANAYIIKSNFDDSNLISVIKRLL